MEPKFLDDETLTSNLDDDKAARVIDWLISIYNSSPHNLDNALKLARGINSLTTLDSDYFDKLMSQLEKHGT